jgi:hypothetical protein
MNILVFHVVLEAMESNIKLMFEELMRGIQSMCMEMKEGFVVHEAMFTARDAEPALTEQQCKKRIAILESMAVEFSAWRSEVESLISSVELELSKLNSFFDRDAKSGNSSKPGVLQLESATTPPALHGFTYGPNGHLSKTSGIVDFGEYFPRSMTQSRVRSAQAAEWREGIDLLSGLAHPARLKGKLSFGLWFKLFCI